MNLARIGFAGLFGYVVGTFPTRELAARMAAGRTDATVSDVDPKATSTQVAGVAAALAKVTIGCVGGLRLAGPMGMVAAGVGGAAGDRFPLWRFLRRKFNRPGAVSG